MQFLLLIGLSFNAIGAGYLITPTLLQAFKEKTSSQAEYYHVKSNKTPQDEKGDNTFTLMGFSFLIVGFVIQAVGIFYNL
jgi:hypothetical protein